MMDYVKKVLVQEGLWSDVQGDRGGQTMRGVTWDLYEQWCNSHYTVPTKEHHKILSEAEARRVYEDIFIVPLRINYITSSLMQEAIFDAAILHGGPRGARFAQRTTGALKVDGLIGPKSLKVLNSTPPVAFANEMAIRRVLFVCRVVQNTVRRGDLTQVKFILGWSRRMLRFIRPVINETVTIGGRYV